MPRSSSVAPCIFIQYRPDDGAHEPWITVGAPDLEFDLALNRLTLTRLEMSTRKILDLPFKGALRLWQLSKVSPPAFEMRELEFTVTHVEPIPHLGPNVHGTRTRLHTRELRRAEVPFAEAPAGARYVSQPHLPVADFDAPLDAAPVPASVVHETPSYASIAKTMRLSDARALVGNWGPSVLSRQMHQTSVDTLADVGRVLLGGRCPPLSPVSAEGILGAYTAKSVRAEPYADPRAEGAD